jgi:hypothetical protein
LVQFNEQRSHDVSRNLLDLVFSNNCLTVERCDDPISNVNIFHPPLMFEILFISRKADKIEIIYRNLKLAPWRIIEQDLMRTNWQTEFDPEDSVDEMVEKFYDVI